MKKVVLGLGSNVGSRKLFINKAVKEITKLDGFKVTALSPFYETGPWGLKSQRNFINCVLLGFSTLKPGELLKKLLLIEKKLGRKKRVKWGPREIDIDILFYGSLIRKRGKPVIPHPMIQERNFVLVPLNEMVPNLIHPVFRKKISTLLGASKDKSTVKVYN